MIAWQKFEIEINGKIATMEVRPLKRKHYGVITALIALEKVMAGKSQDELRTAVADDPDAAERMLQATFNIQEAGSDALAECVKDIKLDGEDIAPADLGEEMAYTHLALGILRKLTDLSSLTEAERKNSQGPSSTEAMDASSMTM